MFLLYSILCFNVSICLLECSFFQTNFDWFTTLNVVCRSSGTKPKGEGIKIYIRIFPWICCCRMLVFLHFAHPLFIIFIYSISKVRVICFGMVLYSKSWNARNQNFLFWTLNHKKNLASHLHDPSHYIFVLLFFSFF